MRVLYDLRVLRLWELCFVWLERVTFGDLLDFEFVCLDQRSDRRFDQYSGQCFLGPLG